MHLELGTIESDYTRWLKSYMRHLKYKDSSKNTLEGYGRILQMLAQFIASQNLAKKLSDNNDNFCTFENEFKISLKESKKVKKIKYLSDHEVYQIIDHLEYMCLNRGSYYDYIYTLGIKCMLYGGLRISEVLSLRLSDFTLSGLTNDAGNHDIYEIHLKETKSGEEQTALIKIEDIYEELLYFRKLRAEHSPIFQSKTKQTLMHRSNFYTSVKGRR